MVSIMDCITPNAATELNAHLYEKARDELGETNEEREKKLAQLKDWINEEPSVQSNIVLDDVSLLWFLRSCKFNTQKTQKRIKTFFKFRATVPEWYGNRDPLSPELVKLLDLGCVLPLPGRDEDYRKVIIIRAAVHDPSQVLQDDVFKISNMVMELLCRDDEATSITGTVALIDLKGVSLGHAMQMTPSIIRKAVSSWQDVYPVRMKGIHFINAPFNINLVLNIFKQFMKEKLRRRLHIHRNVNSLPKLISPDILPPEYGGSGKSVSTLTKEVKECVMQNRDWFLQEKCHGPFSK